LRGARSRVLWRGRSPRSGFRAWSVAWPSRALYVSDHRLAIAASRTRPRRSYSLPATPPPPIRISMAPSAPCRVRSLQRSVRHRESGERLLSGIAPVDSSEGRCGFEACTAIIFGSDGGKFGAPELSPREKQVCVTGELFLWQGNLEIVLRDPKQLSGR
jgi:hypothetical protein